MDVGPGDKLICIDAALRMDDGLEPCPLVEGRYYVVSAAYPIGYPTAGLFQHPDGRVSAVYTNTEKPMVSLRGITGPNMTGGEAPVMWFLERFRKIGPGTKTVEEMLAPLNKPAEAPKELQPS